MYAVWKLPTKLQHRRPCPNSHSGFLDSSFGLGTKLSHIRPKNCRRMKDRVCDRNKNKQEHIKGKQFVTWRARMCHGQRVFHWFFHGTSWKQFCKPFEIITGCSSVSALCLASSLLLPPGLPYSHDPDRKGWYHWVKVRNGILRINLFVKAQGLWAYTFTWKVAHFESSGSWKSGSFPHSCV